MCYFWLTILFLCLGLNIQAQERFFTFTEGWRSLKVLEQPDSSFLSVGLSTSISGSYGNYQFCIISYNGELGNFWEFGLNESSTSQSFLTNDIHQMANGLTITGIRLNELGDTAIGTVFQLDSSCQNLTNQYDYLFGDSRTFIRSSAIPNDSSIVLGSISRTGSSTDFASLVEVDTMGLVRWRKDFVCSPGNCNPFPYHILPLTDGGYIFTLQEEHPCPNGVFLENIQTTLIRTDGQGNEIWRIWPGSDSSTYRQGPYTVQTSDGNLLFAYTDNYTNECLPQGNDTNTVRFVKLALADGETVWEKSLRGILPVSTEDPERGYAYQLTQMDVLSDGKILLIGTEGFKGLMLKMDEEASLIWHREHLPSGFSLDQDPGFGQKMELLGFTETSDGGFIIAGEYNANPGTTFPNGIQSAFALKVDEYGCLEPDCQLADTVGTTVAELINPTEVKIYPNPVKDVLSIEVLDGRGQMSDISITDVLGRAQQFPLEKGVAASSGRGIHTMNLQGLQKGIYILTIQFNDGRNASRKFVKE